MIMDKRMYFIDIHYARTKLEACLVFYHEICQYLFLCQHLGMIQNGTVQIDMDIHYCIHYPLSHEAPLHSMYFF
jgi:hypothetical protein